MIIIHDDSFQGGQRFPFFFFFLVTGIEPRPLCILGMHSTAELHLSSKIDFCNIEKGARGEEFTNLINKRTLEGENWQLSRQFTTYDF